MLRTTPRARAISGHKSKLVARHSPRYNNNPRFICVVPHMLPPWRASAHYTDEHTVKLDACGADHSALLRGCQAHNVRLKVNCLLSSA